MSFLGLVKCGECGASITGEMKTKFYKETQRKAEYVYYSCTKKLGNCLQKPIAEPELELQLRKTVSDVALPESWAEDWHKWLERDEMTDKQLKEENLQKLDGEIITLDQKLNFLLDSYLNSVIDAEIYKKKKNELFEEKLKKTSEITKLQTNGSGWLEPFREFINSALAGGKIARAKNTAEEIAFFGKTVGSDFFLYSRRLVPEYNLRFAELQTRSSLQSPQTQVSEKSLSELLL